jgi:transcriptional regulator of acetoin/glycerol metabolism
MTTRSMLNALTGAILRGQMDVETARNLVITASSIQRQEDENLLQVLETSPTAALAAKTLGISRATLFRRLNADKKAKAKALAASGGA